MFHPGAFPPGPSHLPPAAMAIAVLIPLSTIIAPFIFVYFVIKLKNSQDALLIEKGLYKPATPRERFRRFYLIGIIMLVLGLGLTVGLLPIGFIPKIKAEGMPFFGPWMMPGVLLSFLGAGFLFFARTAFRPEELDEKKSDEDK